MWVASVSCCLFMMIGRSFARGVFEFSVNPELWVQLRRQLEEVSEVFRRLKAKTSQPATNFDCQAWERRMRHGKIDKCNAELYAYIMESIRDGFEAQVDEGPMVSASRNMPTSVADEVAITTWLVEAWRNDWILGPFSAQEVAESAELRRTHLSMLGCVPKPDASSGVRPISDMTQSGVNALVKEGWRTVSYTKLMEIAQMVEAAGPEGYLWVADAANAYLQLRIREADRRLFGVKWLGLLVIFASFIFGLASAPRIYTHFADALEQMICVECGERGAYDGDGVRMIRHYLDDFFGAATTLERAERQFNALLTVWEELKVPWKDSKLSRPARLQRILGFIWSCVDQMVYLPQEKIDRYVKNLSWCLKRKKVKAATLRVMVGRVRWAATVCFGAQAFVRRIEMAMNEVLYSGSGRRVKITAVMRCDLRFCRDMLVSMQPGVPVEYLTRKPNVDNAIGYTDAASKQGMGGVCSTGLYFGVLWSTVWPAVAKLQAYTGEMIAAWALVKVAAKELANSGVTLFNDNTGVEWNLRKKSASRADALEFVADICRVAFHHRFYFWMERVTTDDNTTADQLSRGNDEPCGEQAAWCVRRVDMAAIVEELRSERMFGLIKPYVEQWHGRYNRFGGLKWRKKSKA